MRKISALTSAPRIQRIEGDLDPAGVTTRHRQRLRARSHERQRRSVSVSLRNGVAGRGHEGQGVRVVDVFVAFEEFWIAADSANDADAVVVVVVAAAAALAAVVTHTGQRPRTFVFLFAEKNIVIMYSNLFFMLTQLLSYNSHFKYETKE